MERISEKEEGGEVLKEDRTLFAIFNFNNGEKAGETTPRVRTTVYTETLQIPFEITVVKEIALPLDRDGIPLRKELRSASISAEVKLPFERGNVTGAVAVSVHLGGAEGDVKRMLLQEIGRRVAELQFVVKD